MGSVADVRGAGRRLVAYSPETAARVRELEAENAGLAGCGDEKRNFDTLKLVVNDIILDHRISMDKLKPVLQ